MDGIEWDKYPSCWWREQRTNPRRAGGRWTVRGWAVAPARRAAWRCGSRCGSVRGGPPGPARVPLLALPTLQPLKKYPRGSVWWQLLSTVSHYAVCNLVSVWEGGCQQGRELGECWATADGAGGTEEWLKRQFQRERRSRYRTGSVICLAVFWWKAHPGLSQICCFAIGNIMGCLAWDEKLTQEKKIKLTHSLVSRILPLWHGIIQRVIT